jgi:hypothetical protein
MDAGLTYIMAMSCTIPAAAGIYRYKRIGKKFHPFIFMMLFDMLIETIFYLSIKNPALGKFPQLAVNLYILINFALFLYLVHINNYLSKKLMQLLFAAAMVVAIINYFYSGTLFRTFSFLFCFIWLVNLVISIDILSRQIMALNEKLFNNFWFWVSSAFILYNAFNLLIFGQVFFATTGTSNEKAIGNIQHFVNVACYLFFAIAIFRIPEKKFTSPQ